MNELQCFLAEIASGQRKKGECLALGDVVLLDSDSRPLAKGEAIFHTLTLYGTHTPTQLLTDEDSIPGRATNLQLPSGQVVAIRNCQKCSTEARLLHYNFDWNL